jgi:hypothetical protein
VDHSSTRESESPTEAVDDHPTPPSTAVTPETVPARPDPKTDHQWTVHSINIHGVFFERWSAEVVRRSSPWVLRSENYPVEWPPPNGPIRGKESSLDLRAELQHEDLRITVLVECKKNNPEFIDWVFFQKVGVPNDQFSVDRIVNTPTVTPGSAWTVETGLRQLSAEYPRADDARETRGQYNNFSGPRQNKTRTANDAISSAAHQVALASRAIQHEEARHSRILAERATAGPPYREQLFLPIIVTTARLFTCEFDPALISPRTGEIMWDQVRLVARDEVLYEYPLPIRLQHTPSDLPSAIEHGHLELFTRMPILVVQSESFNGFLDMWANTLSTKLITVKS